MLPIHLSEVPDFEVRGDCVRITWRGAEAYVPIPICLAAMGRCKGALQGWQDAKATIIEFPQLHG